jgi:hypothetical protein
MAREVNDPLGHLRQGLERQDELDARARMSAYQARLKEFDAPGLITHIRATRPPQRALDELDVTLLKITEAIDANLGYPPRLGHPRSRWEQEALQELERLAGKAPAEQPPPVERPPPPPPPPPVRPPPPRPVKPPLVKRSPLSQTKRLPQLYREGERTGKAKRTSPSVGRAARAKAKKPTPAELKRMVAFAQEKFGGLDPIPGRSVTQPALEAELGRAIPREDYRAIMNTVAPSKERKGGRPKNPAK